MSEAFDPDKFLAETQKPAFDPDTFLASMPAQSAPSPTPTLDATGTAAQHFARHATAGLGDKLTAAIQALQDVHHDKTGKVSFQDAYKRDLGFLDQTMEASDKEHPVAKWVGNVAGVGANLAALAPFQGAKAATLLGRVGQGAKFGAGLGAVGGFGGSRADTAGGALGDAAMGAGVGAIAGGAAPVAAEGAGKVAGLLGDKARSAAAWLKVHSLHPTPKLGEAMAALPGGEEGVGRELLERGIGGLTKKGTAKQLAAAVEEAGGVISDIAARHDTDGWEPIDLKNAIEVAAGHAKKLQAEPTTRAAGRKIAKLVAEYRQMYDEPVSASKALEFKRTLANEVYGARKSFAASRDPVVGHYAKGMSKFERAVDDSLDSALGPEFEKSNLTFRRLLGAEEAAKRAAARAQTNKVIGLLHTGAAGVGAAAAGAAAHGPSGAIVGGLGSLLLDKYGSQAGARLFHEAGGALGGLGGALRSMPGLAGAAASESTAPAAVGLTADALPSFADDDSLKRGAVIAALRRRKP